MMSRMFLSRALSVAGKVFAGTVILAGIVAWTLRGWKITKTTFRKVGTVSQLFIYPIKSCRGIAVQSAECTWMGLKNGVMRDRVFLLITPDGTFVTARHMHKMVTIVPSFEGEVLLVNAPGMTTLKIPLLSFQDETTYISCKIWGHPVDGCDCGDEAAKWFQDFLEKPDYRLVYFRTDLKPKQMMEMFGPTFNENDISAYADLTPYMLMTEASVRDLNTKLDQPVGMRNFRPNIVVRDSIPYKEDEWKVIRNEKGVVFLNVKPCERCILTTVDPETGIRTGEEPLKTLRSYRLTDDYDSPLLGIKLCIDELGTIQVGDSLYAL